MHCKECALHKATFQELIDTLIGDNESARNPAAATTRQILRQRKKSKIQRDCRDT